MINLSKGQSSNLNNGKYIVGLGWDFNRKKIDLDISLFMLNDGLLLPTAENFIFYNNTKSPCGSIEHTGDNRDGAGDGNDEEIYINLSTIPSDITQILGVVTIHDETGHNIDTFADVLGGNVNVSDHTGKLIEYNLGREHTNSMYNSLEVFSLTRNGNGWKFNALGIPQSCDLQCHVEKYYNGGVTK